MLKDKIVLQASSKHTQVSLLLAFFIFAFVPVQAAENPVSETSVTPTSSLLLDIANSGNNMLAVGERGHVLYTKDCGGHWNQVSVPTRNTLNSVYYYNQQQVWIVGHDSVILHSKDGGQHWQKRYQDIKAEQPLFDILFVNDNKGFAVGAYGAYLVTGDGGKTWKKTQVYGEDDFHLYAITRMPKGELVISGEGGIVYLSVNQGANWERLKTPYEGTYFGSLVLHNGSLMIYGMRGHLYVSDDLGEHWKKINISKQVALESAIETKDKQLLVTGAGGVVLTINPALDKVQYLKQGHRIHLSSVTQCGNGQVFAVGEKGIVKVK